MTSEGGPLRSFVLATVLFFAALLLCISTPRGDPAAGGAGSNPKGAQRSGELTVRVHATSFFKAALDDPTGTTRDEQTITYEGTTRYKWTFSHHMNELEVISSTSSVSVSGGGSASHPDIPSESKWTYKSGVWNPKQIIAAVGPGDFDWEGGQIRVWGGFLDVATIQCDCHTTVYGKPDSGCGALLQSLSPVLAPTNESSYLKGFMKTVKKEADSFHVNGESSWSGTMVDLRFDGGQSGPAPNLPKPPSAPSFAPHGDFHVSYSVDFTAGGEDPDEVELIPAKDYDRWEPQAGEDESQLGNFIDVQIVAHKKGDPNADPPKKITKYTIELEDTSREKGVDLNWPPKDKAKDDFDMKIDPDNPWIRVTDGNNGQKAETKQGGLTEFMVTVNSYDWGGYTKLHVTAELEDGSSVVGYVRGHPDQDFLLIPKDDNNNHIADYWEHSFKIENPDASADDDDNPHSEAGKGDGIALYDEYRGFHIQGKHESLSPEVKDLFVFDENNLGIGIYGATGISVHLLKEHECLGCEKGGKNGGRKIVTPNGSHGDVYAIHLTKGTIEKGVVGQTEPGPGVPRDIEKVVIDPNEIAGAYGANAAAELQVTIAHELSHATNVRHHGEGPPAPDYNIGDVLCRVPDRSGRPGTQGTLVTVNLPCNEWPRDKNGNAIGTGQPAFDCYEVAAKGGKYSGNDQCWMRYDMTNFYEDPAGNCQWQHNGKTVHGRRYGTDPPGMTMCDDPKGTGVNDTKKPPNKAGDATLGNCKNQLRLK